MQCWGEGDREALTLLEEIKHILQVLLIEHLSRGFDSILLLGAAKLLTHSCAFGI